HIPAASDANNLINIGHQQLNRGEVASAIATFSKAIEQDPRNDLAYANRAISYFWDEAYDKAERDAEQALKLNRSNPVTYRVRGLLAKHALHFDDALADLTRSLQLDDDNSFTYYQRALVYEARQQATQARADAEQAIRRHPADVPAAYPLLARLYQARGDTERAAAQAEALITALPASTQSYIYAAEIYSQLDQNDAAQAAIERGLRAAPDIRLHLTRAALLPVKDVQGRRTAIEAALALNPGDAEALQMRAELESHTLHYQDAIATLSTVLRSMPEQRPERANALMNRGLLYSKLKQPNAAQHDFDAANTVSTTTSAKNNICWALAIRNLALPAALNYCEAALALAPNNVNAWDSKGMVLLRMGRYQDAVSAYTTALGLRASMAPSLYGRGIAQHRLGRYTEGDADIKAAVTLDQSISARFVNYGLKP
ncbi:MAG: tetratricopeptide repeat protein, partial [Sphingomonadaceae bacterium]